MGLMKAPSLLTFIIALAIATAAVMAHFGMLAPLTAAVSFWMLLGAFGLMLLGTITRGL
jgi:hypothetical protein